MATKPFSKKFKLLSNHQVKKFISFHNIVFIKWCNLLCGKMTTITSIDCSVVYPNGFSRIRILLLVLIQIRIRILIKVEFFKLSENLRFHLRLKKGSFRPLVLFSTNLKVHTYNERQN